MNQIISWNDFAKIRMHVGTIMEASVFTQARKPAYILHIDFGPLGTRKSSAQVTKLYSTSELVGQQVIAVLNFPPKQIATIQSQCLVLGVTADDGKVILLQPGKPANNGDPVG